MCKKSIEKVRDWLIENRTDKYGNLDLRGLDFSDFEGDVNINCMKVKKDLHQSWHKVNGRLIQNWQKVEGNLMQNFQEVKGDLIQNYQEVKGLLYSHKLKDDEKWIDDYYCCIIREKKK